MQLPLSINSAQIWKNIIGDYIDTEYLDTPADFDPVKGVIESPWCTQTGKIAGQYCPKSSQMGYWKSTNAPTCDVSHWVAPDPTDAADNNDDPNGNQTGGENPGGENPGGNQTGGENPGGNQTGGENPGGNQSGGENPGGNQTGGENPGGNDPGGNQTGGENPGGEYGEW